MKSHLNSYKQYLLDNNKSKNTITSYLTDLEHYFSLHQKISREDIQSYKKQISHLSATSINRKLSSIKSYNNYLVSIGIMNYPLYVIKTDFIKVQQKGNPTNITGNQVAKFLKKIEERNSVYKSRNLALIYLIGTTGIRREEACNIELRNLDLEHEEIKLIGKGNKERVVLFPNEIIPILEQYLEDRNKYRHSDSPYLFVSERGNKLTKETINDIFEKYWTPKNKISPHQLRHNFASSVLEQGVFTLAGLQEQLGHSSIATTGRYVHPRRSEMKKKINKLNICAG